MNPHIPEKPTIFYDTTLEKRYGKYLSEMNCVGQSMYLLDKGTHILIPPNFAVFIWNPNAKPKEIYDQIQFFRKTYLYRLIIIEGTPDDSNSQNFCGLQMKLWLEGFDAIQPSQNAPTTCMILKSLAMRLQIKDNPPSLNRGKPKGDLKAHHLNLLEGLVGTGSQKAEILLANLGSALAVIESIDKQQEMITNIKGFGPEFIAANRILLRKKLN